MSALAVAETRVAILVDCDNISPEVLDHALQVAAQFGRVVLRRGYGCHSTLANKWQEALVRLAFAPCLQIQFAAGKNTSDIALALDALEASFDGRADMFCLVTSDSDFTVLCRKLRERGASVCIVGEAKTPTALRNASDKFFEWVRPQAGASSPEVTKSKSPQAIVKRRPQSIVTAVASLATDQPDGKVGMYRLGAHLRHNDAHFSPKTYRHSCLLAMVKTYELLSATQEPNGHWSVSLVGQTGITAGTAIQLANGFSLPHDLIEPPWETV